MQTMAVVDSRSDVAGGQEQRSALRSFLDVLRAEWVRFTSVKATWVCLGLVLIVGVGLGTLISSSQHSTSTTHGGGSGGPGPSITSATTLAEVGIFLTQIVVGVLGAIWVTSEFSTGSLRTTLAAYTKRRTLLLAKAIVVSVVVFVVAEITSFAAFLLSQAVLPSTSSYATTLGASGVAEALFLAGLYLALLSLVGLGLGVLTRSTAASIAVFVSVIFAVPLVIKFLPTSWTSSWERYLPSNAGSSMYSTTHASGVLSALHGTEVMVLYAVAAIVASMVVFTRRSA
jgi:ABC-type transport system involved in multi-copper enzyme maturation permease subunit